MVLRYMTQDIGTAIQRERFSGDWMVYTVGKQHYHFKVLFLIWKKLGFGWSAHENAQKTPDTNPVTVGDAS
jgi:arginyl-tRNA synthetase